MCRVDLGRFQPAPFIRAMRGNTDLGMELNLSLQQLRLVLMDLGELKAARDGLIDMIRREMEQK